MRTLYGDGDVTSEEGAPLQVPEELRAVVHRLAMLMDWEPHESHKFDIVRQVCRGTALAMSVDKGNQLADKLERLMAVAEYIEMPLVLCSIPQPHRMRLSELLHGGDTPESDGLE